MNSLFYRFIHFFHFTKCGILIQVLFYPSPIRVACALNEYDVCAEPHLITHSLSSHLSRSGHGNLLMHVRVTQLCVYSWLIFFLPPFLLPFIHFLSDAVIVHSKMLMLHLFVNTLRVNTEEEPVYSIRCEKK